MKINFTSFATTFSLVFSFILCFSLHYNETEKLSSVIKPLVRNYIANWELGQANISINVLSSENSRISSFAIYRKKSESIIFGDKWVIKEIDKLKFHFSDGLYIYWQVRLS